MQRWQESTDPDSDAIYQPTPLKKRTPSYTEKFNLSNPCGKSSKSDPRGAPEPVKTPSIEQIEQHKFGLQRSHTSNYQKELLSRTKHHHDIEIAGSPNEAYHLQQKRNRSKGAQDFFAEVSKDKLSLIDNEFPHQEIFDPDRHTGLLSHPPEEKPKSYTLSGPESDKSGSRSNSGEEINDMNQFKRRFSWWS